MRTSVRSASPDALYDSARHGDRRARARLLTLLEAGGEAAHLVARLAYPDAHESVTIGVTGAPGAGKSTLVSALVHRMRADEVALAVLAVDPSSPFTGGAILGDRVRMDDHVLDPGVFIRSMATRGHLGGLTLAARDATRLLAATGAERVLVETVGVGQVEIDIVHAADTTIVVVNPGWGDAVQASKAGLLEVADIFVINKADRDGTAQTRRDLKAMLRMVERTEWAPPVVETVATDGRGVDALWEAVEAHRRYLEASGELQLRRSERLRVELQTIVTEQLRHLAIERCGSATAAALEADVVAGRLDPYSAADRLLAGVSEASARS